MLFLGIYLRTLLTLFSGEYHSWGIQVACFQGPRRFHKKFPSTRGLSSSFGRYLHRRQTGENTSQTKCELRSDPLTSSVALKRAITPGSLPSHLFWKSRLAASHSCFVCRSEKTSVLPRYSSLR